MRDDAYGDDRSPGGGPFIGTKDGPAKRATHDASTADGTANHLRVARSGEEWNLRYSANSVTGEHGSKLTFAMAVSSVGVYAGNPFGGRSSSSEGDHFPRY